MPEFTNKLGMAAIEPPEKARTYFFPETKSYVRLEGVTHLKVRESGCHQLRTADGKLHIVPTGWNHIKIDAEDFVF